jgi:uncharacterized protein (DUF1684 family)
MASDDPFEISREHLEREVAEYRKARAARLASDKGWLTLIGKFWLTPGSHRIGTTPDSQITLPASRAPESVGTVTLEGGVVRLEASASAELYARGERVTSIVLKSDAEPDPDDVTLGSLTLQLIRRGDDLAIRVRDSNSAARLSFDGVPAYPVDPAWRIVARFEAFSTEREVVFDDSDGRPQRYVAPGVAVFEHAGVACRLLPVFESDRKRLFVLFSDPTNRDETYGSGRFLYAPLPERGRIVLDFNKAFNPPCAFTPYAVCPLPPAENRMAVPVEAGEKRPTSHAG